MGTFVIYAMSLCGDWGKPTIGCGFSGYSKGHSCFRSRCFLRLATETLDNGNF